MDSEKWENYFGFLCGQCISAIASRGGEVGLKHYPQTFHKSPAYRTVRATYKRLCRAERDKNPSAPSPAA